MAFLVPKRSCPTMHYSSSLPAAPVNISASWLWWRGAAGAELVISSFSLLLPYTSYAASSDSL